MSDQVLERDSVEWGVEWASARTWIKLIMLTFAIVFVGLGIAVAVAIFVHILGVGMTSLGLAGWLDHWTTGSLIFLIQWCVPPVLFMLLAMKASDLHKASTPEPIPDTFPARLWSSEDIEVTWFFLMMAFWVISVVAGITLIAAGSSMENVRANLADFDVDETVIPALLGFILASQYLSELAWWLMAERRPHGEWTAAAAQWHSIGPRVVMWLLSAVAVLGGLLIISLFFD